MVRRSVTDDATQRRGFRKQSRQLPMIVWWRSMNHSAELQAALDAAEQAAAIARSLYQRNIEVRIKADKSPVTEADVRCELAIREIIETRFPSHGFYGEETGAHHEDAEYLWLVDPIDGTKAFVREY